MHVYTLTVTPAQYLNINMQIMCIRIYNIKTFINIKKYKYIIITLCLQCRVHVQAMSMTH